VILVRDRSSIYLAGPPLVKAAIGEDTTDEELGGAVMHAQVTGLGEYLCEDDAHAIAMAREVIDKLQWDSSTEAAHVAAPLYDEQELLGCVSADDREPFDTREVIARIVDGSDFLEFKADTPVSMGTWLVSWATTARFNRMVRSRLRSSFNCAIKAVRPWSFCRTRPATWSGLQQKRAGRSSMAPR
jgi:hypothetical protein